MKLPKSIPVFDLKNKPSQEIPEGFFKIYQLKSTVQDHHNLDSVPFQTNIPHRHSFYEICVFQEGEGHHEIDFVQHKIQPASVHVILPGQVHRIATKPHTRGYVLAFDSDFYTFTNPQSTLPRFAQLLQHQGAQVLNLSTEHFQEFLEVTLAILNEYRKNRHISAHVIRAHLQILIIKGNYFFQNLYNNRHTSGKAHQLMHTFQQSIEQNYCNKHLVREYAEELSLSVNQLNRLAREITGKTASDLINARVILEAKRHLTFSKMSTKQIAYILGFQDPSYFSRFFKRKTGYSPSQFKQLLRKNT